MAKKGKTVDLEESLHNAVKGAGSRRGMSVPEVYTEALSRWLEWIEGGAKRESPFGDLSEEEENVICAVLEWILRNPNLGRDDPTSFKRSLLEIGRLWAKRVAEHPR